ncbi:MAG: type II toxin-antitoxin system HicA family toxin [Candidatus Omnitrophica bacterium]|nr:type II toxin-antitoxin system HicA family toxin [Candidatus Omnitrophota bacterium]
MAKLPVVSAKDLIRALEKDGFVTIRQKGSHVVLQKKTPAETITTVVPYHSEIAKGTLRSILRKARLTPDQLSKLLVLVLGTSHFF